MKNEFLLAIGQLAAERNLPKDIVFEAIETALASAYRRDENGPSLVVRIDRETGDTHVYLQKVVVDEVEDPETEIATAEAKRWKPDAKDGDVLDFEAPVPADAGRIAAQTAKQVVLQKIREAERDAVYDEYNGREGEIVVGTVQRIEARQAIMEIGRGTEASLPISEQVRAEHLRSGARVKVVILRVEKAAKGPQVIVSRGHRTLLRRLFELEVPEVQKGTVEIKSIAREGGHRSKIAVHSRVPSIDPIGACVGMRGSRIQNIINELGGERIDVIKWDPNPANFISNALSPSQVIDVEADLDAHQASVVVPERMMSLAIGKEGQNARLAAKLTGWRIDIRAQVMEGEEAPEAPAAVASFVPFQEGEEADVDLIAGDEVEEIPEVVVAPATEPAAATAQPEPAAAAETGTPAAAEDELDFAAALQRMAVPRGEERESEEYGEDEDEEYEIPAAIVEESRPAAIRFAEDVLGAQREREAEEAKKAAAAKRPRRAPRYEEEEEEDEINYSGRIR